MLLARCLLENTVYKASLCPTCEVANPRFLASLTKDDDKTPPFNTSCLILSP